MALVIVSPSIPHTPVQRAVYCNIVIPIQYSTITLLLRIISFSLSVLRRSLTLTWSLPNILTEYLRSPIPSLPFGLMLDVGDLGVGDSYGDLAPSDDI